ncbi:MAG: transketolase [Rhodospirillales bacterium]|nr:transketolase [Rhodospirillales bacterium]
MTIPGMEKPSSARDPAAALEDTARRYRATCVQMAHDGREGHLTSALSCADIVACLYGHFLNVSPERPDNPRRDRFILSKGHAATIVYAALAERGFIPRAELAEYARGGSRLPNHVCRHALPVIEASAGSLGHGLGIATGMLYGMRLAGLDGRAVVLMSDGECNEGSVWESAAFACARKMDRLLAIVDNNNMQAVGRTDQLLGFTSLEEKFRAFGWAAITIDGHSVPEILAALDRVPFVAERPSAIIARTIGGHGISFIADRTEWHYRVPNAEQVALALAELGVPPLHKETP